MFVFTRADAVRGSNRANSPSHQLRDRLTVRDNTARLHLFVMAYNLANFLRQLVLPKPIRSWTLTTLREKLIKIGAKVVSHAKYVLFQLAEAQCLGNCSRRS